MTSVCFSIQQSVNIMTYFKIPFSGRALQISHQIFEFQISHSTANFHFSSLTLSLACSSVSPDLYKIYQLISDDDDMKMQYITPNEEVNHFPYTIVFRAW